MTARQRIQLDRNPTVEYADPVELFLMANEIGGRHGLLSVGEDASIFKPEGSKQ